MYFIVAIISCIESFAVTIFFVKACITYLEIEIRFTQSLHGCPFVGHPTSMPAIVRKRVFGKITRTDDHYICGKLMSSGLDFSYFFKHANYLHSVRDIANG